MCLLSFVGFVKAAKIARVVAKGIKSGKTAIRAISAAAGAFFCTSMWDAAWEWDECNSGLQIMFAGSTNADELAGYLEQVADDLEDGRIPDPLRLH